MGLQDRDYMKDRDNKNKSARTRHYKPNEQLTPKQKNALKSIEKQLNKKKQQHNFKIAAAILIGGGLIIYGLLTHLERLLPIPANQSKPIYLN